MDNIVLSSFDLNKIVEQFSTIVEEKIKALKTKELQEKLLSPAETCKLFEPAISKPTLQSWTEQGLLKDYRIGGRVYYRYSEIIAAAKHLKRYKKSEHSQEAIK